MGATTQHRTRYIPTCDEHGNTENDDTTHSTLHQERGDGPSHYCTPHNTNLRDGHYSTATSRTTIQRHRFHHAHTT
eukprot:3602686-Prorocentrum_lima.AAC.1